MTRAYVMAAGEIDLCWADKVINSRDKNDILIAADKGIVYLEKIGAVPDIFVGDLDSVPDYFKEKLKNSEIKTELHPVRKDETDLRLAMLDLINLKADEVYILGATGGRLDHFLANIYICVEALMHGIRAYILDPQNRISILSKGAYILKKEDSFGKYVSFIPFGGDADIISLSGFSYDIDKVIHLKSYDTIGISNEIVSEQAKIDIGKGCLIMVEAKDKNND